MKQLNREQGILDDDNQRYSHCEVCEGAGVIDWDGVIVNCPKCDGVCEAQAQADTYTEAESSHYYSYFQGEMLAEWQEANDPA